jgi:hypothetical protein
VCVGDSLFFINDAAVFYLPHAEILKKLAERPLALQFGRAA